MLLKLSTIVLAAAALVSAGSATARFQMTYLGTLASNAAAVTDWNNYIGRTLAAELAADTTIRVGNSDIEPGPEGVENNFFVTNTVTVEQLTDAAIAAQIGTWSGRTFRGRSSGVTWHIDNVSF